MKAIFSFTAIVFFCLVISANAADNIKAFPPADEGMTRYVLELPEYDDESLVKVELIVGKTVAVDDVNQYFFVGKIEEGAVQGWGFPFYYVKELGPMAGTLMAVDPESPIVSKFIMLNGEPYLIHYNSRLPIVVYVPEDAEVKYRIWFAEEEITMMEEN